MRTRLRELGATGSRPGPSTPRRCASSATSGPRSWVAPAAHPGVQGLGGRRGRPSPGAGCGPRGRPRPVVGGRVGQGLARHGRRLRQGLRCDRPPGTCGLRPPDRVAPHHGLRGRQDRALGHRLRGRPAHARRHALLAGAMADEVRRQYRHFVVDEYQDVSPLQQFVLDQWLGGRKELCVVGDPSQTIYSFTGATPTTC
ncbi:UvrD-helicase domain-containing protein [Oerskovia sp. M15]